MPLDLDAVSGPLDLDAEPEQPGLLSRAWSFATKPILQHWKEAAPDQAAGIDRFGGVVESVVNAIPKPGFVSARIPQWQVDAVKDIPVVGTVARFANSGPSFGQATRDASLLDAAAAPAGMAGRVGQGGRLIEIAQAAGIGGEGIAQLQEARATGDWSKVPEATVRLLLAKMGMSGGLSGAGSKGSLDDVARAAEEAALSPFERQTRRVARQQPDVPPTNFAGPEILPPPPTVSRFETQSRALTDQMPAGQASSGARATPPGFQKKLSYEERLRARAANAPEPMQGPPTPTVEQQFAGAKARIASEGPLDLDALEASAGGPQATIVSAQPPSPLRAEPDDLMRAVQEADEAVSTLTPDVAARLGQLPAPAEGVTRVYRGEGPLSKGGGNWFSTEPAEAASYAADGGKLLFVDVPTARLRQLNETIGRDPDLMGEFDFSGGMEGYAARASEVPPTARVLEPVAPTSDLEAALQKSVQIAEPLKAAGATPAQISSQLQQQRGGEAGFANVDLLTDAAKAANRGVGDFLRASVAGDFVTAIRNVQSGLRMVGQAMIEGPVAAGYEKLGALRARAQGNVTKALELDRAAKLQMETAKAFGKATFEEGAATFADALSQLSGGRIKLGQGSQAFDARLKLMENVGDKKLAEKLGSFSSTSVTQTDSKWRKGLMFANILGDRFINRTYLKAHVDAAQKVFGAASPQQLEQMAARNPVVKKQLEEFLVNAGSEAFRASWQNPGASGYTKSFISALDSTPLGLVVQPFAKAFFANMVPNVIEKIPFAAAASKRVRNSWEFHANKNLIETLGPAAQIDPTVAQKVRDLQKANRELAKDGVYSPAKIAARQVMGGLVVAAAVTRRLQSGDDGTEFDQMHVQSGPDGKANKVASFTSQAGEDLPFWYLGDVIGHKILAEREGRPSKYDGKDGTTSIKGLMKAMYGSRYGVQTPAMDMIGALIGGKTEFDNQYIDRMARGISEDLGRMAGAGSWVGGTARRVAAATDPEEAKLRRSDVTEARGPLARVKEAFVEGAQSQVPKNPFGVPDRTQLPETISWSKLGTATNVDPAAAALGGSLSEAEKLMDDGKPISALLSLLPGSNRMEVSRLDRFAQEHQGQVSLSEILPRRTQQPAYDQLVLKHLKEGLEKRALPALRSGKIDELSPEAQVTWFRNLASIREDATEKAGREFRKLTGEYPEGELLRRQKKTEKRDQQRRTRRELRSVGYGRPQMVEDSVQ